MRATTGSQPKTFSPRFFAAGSRLSRRPTPRPSARHRPGAFHESALWVRSASFFNGRSPSRTEVLITLATAPDAAEFHFAPLLR